MDKKLFRKDDKAVSPVIGVILMVAITVILAAAIGSSVFSHGTAESAPQANLDIKAGNISASGTTPDIKIEHLGGSAIHFEDPLVTKVTASLNGGASVEIDATDLQTMGVGDVAVLELIKSGTTAEAFAVAKGNTVEVKIIDAQTNQMICDKNIRF
jgi:flagellin-like protein